MNDSKMSLDIEKYLGGDMSPGEREEFERRLQNDPEFNALYQTYKIIDESMRDREMNMEKEDALKQTLGKLNRRYFSQEASGTATPVVTMAPRNRSFKVALAVAAAVATILSIWLFWSGSSDPRHLAGQYINGELGRLGQTMSQADSMQTGIERYNDKKYDQALAIFNEIYQRNQENYEALRAAGITYLATGEDDKALEAFDELSKISMQSNDGLFLKALTLMHRNSGSDKDTARMLLQQVVDQQLDKSEVAVQWLKRWK